MPAVPEDMHQCRRARQPSEGALVAAARASGAGCGCAAVTPWRSQLLRLSAAPHLVSRVKQEQLLTGLGYRHGHIATTYGVGARAARGLVR